MIQFNFQKKMIGLFFLILPGFFILFGFQNCSPVQFESIEELESFSAQDDNKKKNEICSLGESKRCEILNGEGIKECKPDLSGFDDKCRLVSCDTGYQPINGECRISECSNGAVNAPSCTDCGASAVMVADKCIAKICEPNQAQENCSIVEHGKSARVCNAEGTGYGACQVIECEQDYKIENNQCVLKLCENGAVNPPLCDQCSSDKYYDGQVCLAQVCGPNTEASCEIANGEGLRTCNEQGSGYGSCVLQRCSVNYTPSGNVCVPVAGNRDCVFNGQTIPVGGSTKAYQKSSVPSGSSCVSETRFCINGSLSGTYQNANCFEEKPISCPKGYTLSNGQCIANVCDGFVVGSKREFTLGKDSFDWKSQVSAGYTYVGRSMNVYNDKNVLIYTERYHGDFGGWGVADNGYITLTYSVNQMTGELLGFFKNYSPTSFVKIRYVLQQSKNGTSWEDCNAEEIITYYPPEVIPAPKCGSEAYTCDQGQVQNKTINSNKTMWNWSCNSTSGNVFCSKNTPAPKFSCNQNRLICSQQLDCVAESYDPNLLGYSKVVINNATSTADYPNELGQTVKGWSLISKNADGLGLYRWEHHAVLYRGNRIDSFDIDLWVQERNGRRSNLLRGNYDVCDKPGDYP